MLNLGCPTKPRLSKYLLGTLAEHHAGKIMVHLDHCNQCEATLQRLETVSDDVIDGLRRSRTDNIFLQEDGYQRLLAAVEEIGLEQSISQRLADDKYYVRQLNEYRLLAKLGKGGMGAVYKALHTRLDRVVALKVLPRDRMRKHQAIVRFQREIKVIAKLDHPNIIHAHDAGEADGMHYLVMELVDGMNLNRLIKQHGPLSVPDACELARQASVGLQYAHEHMMVHRDIKPSNLMVTRSGQVKILDMGLALFQGQYREDHELTSTGQMMGTLDYMAPEQGNDSHKVDIRADIYSLGATLYKLLCGQAPFAGEKYGSAVKKMMALANQPAPPISNERPEIPANLAEIIHRMLAKNPEHRYRDPNEVAEALTPFAAHNDVVRLLANLDNASISVSELPVLASGSPLADSSIRSVGSADMASWEGDSWPEHSQFVTTGKSVERTATQQAKRRKLKQPLSCLVFLTISSMTGWFVLSKMDMATYRNELESSSFQVKEKFRLPDNPTLATTSEDIGFIDGLRQTAADNSANKRVTQLETSDSQSERYGQWSAEQRWTLDSPTGEIQSVQFSPDGQILVASTDFNTVALWDIRTGELLPGAHVSSTGVQKLVFSPDSSFFATRGPHRRIELWNTELLTISQTNDHTCNSVHWTTCLDFAANGRTLATGGQDGTILLWDIETGKTTRLLGDAEENQNRPWVHQLKFSPDGRVLASTWSPPNSSSCSALIWDVPTGKLRSRLAERAHHARELTFAEDGRTIATIGQQGNVVNISDVSSGKKLREFRDPMHYIMAVTFSRDGRTLACARDSHGIGVWTLSTASLDRVLDGHAGSVDRLLVGPDRNTLLSAGQDNRVLFWGPDTSQPELVIPGHADHVAALAISSDGQNVALAGNDKRIIVWTLQHRTR